MRICQVLASTGEGGLEKHVRELSAGLARRGHEVIVLCSDEYGHSLSRPVQHLSLNFQRSRWNPFLTRDLRHALNQCGCDIIHAHANKAVALLGGLRKKLSAPLIGTLHGLKKDISAYRKMDHVIAVSHKAAERLTGIPHTVIYNGISGSEPHRVDLYSAYKIPQTQPVLCALGRLAPVKAFDVLLEAIDGLAVSLLIAGEGPERANLERRIAELKPPALCKLIGHHDAPVDLMASSSGVIISSHREGFPYVLVEALVHRVPVISTDVSDVRRMLANELVVPVNDAPALRAAIQTQIQQPAHWQALMAPAFQHAQQTLTKDAMLDRTLQTYAAALQLKHHADN